MKKEQIIVTGCSSMVGSRCIQILSSKFDILGIGTKQIPLFPGSNALLSYSQCDIRNYLQLERVIRESEASTIIHLAGLVDLDKGEQTRNLGQESLWWQVNVEGTKNLAKIAQKEKKRLIYASTDYLFGLDGGPFSEDDHVAQNEKDVCWYAWTKLQGEKYLAEILNNWVSVRFSIPFRSFFCNKFDFARLVIDKFKNNKEIILYNDQLISPVFIDDLADFFGFLITGGKGIKGIIHFAGGFDPNNPPSPYSFGQNLLERCFGHRNRITPSSYVEFLKTTVAKEKAPRPLRAGLICNRLLHIGYPQPLLTDEIRRFYEQIRFT